MLNLTTFDLATIPFQVQPPDSFLGLTSFCWVAEPFLLVELIWASRCLENLRAKTSLHRTLAITAAQPNSPITGEELQAKFVVRTNEFLGELWLEIHAAEQVGEAGVGAQRI